MTPLCQKTTTKAREDFKLVGGLWSFNIKSMEFERVLESNLLII